MEVNINLVERPQSPTRLQKLPYAVDTWFSWVVCVACFCNVTIGAGVAMNCGVYLTKMIEYYESSRASGYVIGALSYTFLYSTGVVSSFLIDKTSHRTTSIVGSILACLGLVAAANVPSMPWQYFTFSITAIGSGLMFHSNVVVLVHHFKKYREIATTTVLTGIGVGTLFYPVLCIEVIERYAWQPSLYIIAGICLNMCVGSMFMFPVKENPQDTEDVDSDTNDKHQLYHKDNKFPCNNEVLPNNKLERMPSTELLFQNKTETNDFYINSNSYCNKIVSHSVSLEEMQYIPRLKEIKLFYVLLLNVFLWSGSCVVPFVLAADMYTEAKFHSSAQSKLFIILGLSNTIGRFVPGIILNLKIIRPTRFYTICNFIWAVGVALYAINNNYICLIVANLIFGFFFGTFISVYSLVTLEVVGFQNLNRAFGFVGLTLGASGITLPPLIGLAYDYTRNYSLALLIAASTVFISAIISCFLRPLAPPQRTNKKCANESKHKA